MAKQSVRERAGAAVLEETRGGAVEEPRPDSTAAETEKPEIRDAGDEKVESRNAGNGKAEKHGTQLVTFLLKDEEFGFDIMSVQEIIRLPKMARLPHTPDYVEGVSNLRGAVLPIIDIRARFGMKREERTERSRVLVLDIDGRRTGLLVDGVRQVTQVAWNEFEKPPAAIRNGTADYVDGVVKLDNGERIIIALDARRVCQSDGNEGSAQLAGEKRNADVERSSGSTQETVTAGVPAGDPGVPGRRSGGDMHQLVSFQVGREEFAFPMEDVREILRVQTPKEVPGAPEHLLGVLTVRGRILPIVDLRRLLRLDSFASEHVAACRQAGAGYEKLLASAGAVASGRREEAQKIAHHASAASERLRAWLSAFNSSSQALMETIAHMRSINDQVAKHAAVVGNGSKDPQAQHREIVASAEAIVAALHHFQGQIEGHIREDQRIIVVDSNGFQLGLVVDHVNEVLGVRDEAIEAPPSLGKHEGIGLSGIAKLDEGNRLILLLATGNLLDSQNLAELADGLESTTAKQDAKAAAKIESSATDHELQLVTFLLGKEEYGIPIASIQEIDRLSKITQTPKAPKFVEGVTNLRGEVIPVLSTRTLFALDAKVSDDRTRVIIVDLGGAKTGLVVDSVKEVLSISSRNIAPPPASISQGGEGQFISGIGKVDEGKRMIVLLDVARVLTRGEQNEVVALGRAS